MPATLLLADDSVTIQRVMALTFDGEDVRVISVGDGEQAIRRIDADAPDIVLADVSMPKVDGYGVASHIKQSPALSHIPVLLLTGAFDPIDEAKAAACGCDGVLVKPFEPRALVSRVAELLASRPPRSAVPVAPHPALQVVPVASVPPPGPVATLAPRSVRVPPPPGVDDRAAAEFARDMDDLRRAIVSTPANEQAWDPVVRPDGPPATAGLAHEFDFGTAALDVVRRDENRPAPRAETPHQPAGASSPRQAPPEWEAELLREPVAPSPESAVSAPDFGDWDLPARPVPMVHPDDGELLTTPSGGERIELREPARATPVAPAPPAPAVPPPLLRTWTFTEVIFWSTGSTRTQTFRLLTLPSMVRTWLVPGLRTLSRSTTPFILTTSSEAA